MFVDSGLIRKLSTYFIRLPANLGARVYLDKAQSIGDATWNTAIDFSNERWDTGSTGGVATPYPNGIWDAASPARLVAVQPGFYVVSGSIAWAVGVGIRGLAIEWNDATPTSVFIARDLRLGCGANTETEITISTLYWFNKGEWVELHPYQNSGGVLDVVRHDGWSAEFSMVRIP